VLLPRESGSDPRGVLQVPIKRGQKVQNSPAQTLPANVHAGERPKRPNNKS
jgi:hypothetical protein